MSEFQDMWRKIDGGLALKQDLYKFFLARDDQFNLSQNENDFLIVPDEKLLSEMSTENKSEGPRKPFSEILFSTLTTEPQTVDR
eukprot:UN18265